MINNYTIIVPRADRTGPTNLAVDIGKMAINKGWYVKLLYLSKYPIQADVSRFHEVRKFRLSDLFTLKGVVHTHGFRPDLVGWIVSLFTQSITITTLHGHFPLHLNFDYARWKVSLVWFLWSKILNRLDICVGLSKTMIRYYNRILPSLKISLAYNFRSKINVNSKFNPEILNILKWLEIQRKQNRIILIYVGSFNSRKNVISLVKEVNKSKDLSLILCGDGPLKKFISHLILENSDDRIKIATNIFNPGILIERSDILILPSFAEGFPLVILEAAQRSVPALMSNIAVHRELETYGLGLTFNHKTYYNFREKVLFLASSQSLILKRNLKKVWISNFSPKIGFNCYEDLILNRRNKNI
jgi:hypothetical protein